jgi:hypothetical protein
MIQPSPPHDLSILFNWADEFRAWPVPKRGVCQKSLAHLLIPLSQPRGSSRPLHPHHARLPLPGSPGAGPPPGLLLPEVRGPYVRIDRSIKPNKLLPPSSQTEPTRSPQPVLFPLWPFRPTHPNTHPQLRAAGPGRPHREDRQGQPPAGRRRLAPRAGGPRGGRGGHQPQGTFCVAVPGRCICTCIMSPAQSSWH